MRKADDAVAEVAAAWVKDHVAASPAERSDLRVLLREHPAASPDYDDLHASFAAEFLLVNYHKCVAALTDARPEPAATVVDLGCGSGAASAAALAYLFEAGVEWATVHLLDRSERQLELAVSLLNEVAATLGEERQFRVDIDPVKGDWPTERPEKWAGPAMVLASHVLTENQTHAWDFLNRAVELAGPRGSVTVVERADDPLWTELDKVAAERDRPAVRCAQGPGQHRRRRGPELGHEVAHVRAERPRRVRASRPRLSQRLAQTGLTLAGNGLHRRRRLSGQAFPAACCRSDRH
jgi:SAM-dependent methyltransferase